MGRSIWFPAAAAAALLIITFATYAPALRAGFIIDDDEFVGGEVTGVRSFDLQRVWFRLGETHQYYPLAYTTFRAESRLYGANPHPYHRTNIVLHALNALLLWAVLRRLSIPGAWFASALFAVHPVQVESVAWIAERKTLLSAGFYLLSLLVFIRFHGLDRAARPGKGWILYGLSLLLFAGALLSKTAALTLPAAILLLIWWKRGRIARRDVLLVAPFFAIGLALGMVTNWVERTYCGASGALWDLSAIQRVLVAGRALCFYAAKIAMPVHLSFNYGRWTIDPGLWWWFLYPLAVLAVLGSLWILRGRIGRGPLAALLFFAGTLFPVLGFFNIFFFRYSYVADHFQYLACIGLIVLAVASTARLLSSLDARGRRIGALAGVLVGGVLVAALAGLSWNRAHAFESRETLCRDTLEENPKSWLAENNLGDIYLKKGELGPAMEHLERALALGPDYIETRINLAIAMMNLGRFDEAIEQAKRAVEIDPRNVLGYHQVGSAYLRAGRAAEAIPWLQEALALDPSFVKAQVALGTALAQAGRADEGIAWLEKALVREPENPTALTNLGIALANLGRYPESIRRLEEASRLDPNNPAIMRNLDIVRERAKGSGNAAGPM